MSQETSAALATVWLPVIAALALVIAPRAWRILRPVVTVAHEGGHVAVALLAGRRLAGVRVHADASGSTRSRGSSGGLGMVATLVAGYVTPCVLGLAAVALVDADMHQVILIGGVVLLAALLVTVRNAFGFLAIALTGAALVAVVLYASPGLQRAGAGLLAWFLLFGGVRSVADMRRGRRQTAALESDADQLAALTSVPAGLWVLTFVTVALGAVGGAVLLTMPA